MARFAAGQNAVLVATTGDRSRRRCTGGDDHGDRARERARPGAAASVARPDWPRSWRLHVSAALQGSAGNRKARLAVLRETEDGFRIAEEDLRLRGEGDVLGTRAERPGPAFRSRGRKCMEYLGAARDDAALDSFTRCNHYPRRAATHCASCSYVFGKDEAIRADPRGIALFCRAACFPRHTRPYSFRGLRERGQHFLCLGIRPHHSGGNQRVIAFSTVISSSIEVVLRFT